ncbi:MAG: thioredoxin family protein [Solirubrobacterales bacterium]|nr:thioredoxin family protein [Solirubrobacterales bacterium]
MDSGHHRRPPGFAALAVLALTAALLAACNDSDSASDGGEIASIPAASASDFPDAPDDLDSLLSEGELTNEIIVSPASSVFTPGENRLSLGVFNVDGSQVPDAKIAIYAAPSKGDGKVLGPFPAAVESLETDAAFVARTTSDDPDSAKTVYVADVELPEAGSYDLAAVIDQGDKDLVSIVPTITVGEDGPIPDVGQMAPSAHTETTDDVGEIAEIDTRVPPGTMHDVDLADVIGEKPVALLFATPALCMSQVCGPVVDIAEEVKAERPDDAAYIHQEIYVENNPNQGTRPPVREFGLQTEPWLFVLDAEGRVSTRIEGAFSAAELEAALDGAQG